MKETKRLIKDLFNTYNWYFGTYEVVGKCITLYEIEAENFYDRKYSKSFYLPFTVYGTYIKIHHEEFDIPFYYNNIMDDL